MMAVCTSQTYHSYVVKGCKRELGVLQGVHFLAVFRIWNFSACAYGLCM